MQDLQELSEHSKGNGAVRGRMSSTETAVLCAEWSSTQTLPLLGLSLLSGFNTSSHPQTNDRHSSNLLLAPAHHAASTLEVALSSSIKLLIHLYSHVSLLCSYSKLAVPVFNTSSSKYSSYLPTSALFLKSIIWGTQFQATPH